MTVKELQDMLAQAMTNVIEESKVEKLELALEAFLNSMDSELYHINTTDKLTGNSCFIILSGIAARITIISSVVDIMNISKLKDKVNAIKDAVKEIIKDSLWGEDL